MLKIFDGGEIRGGDTCQRQDQVLLKLDLGRTFIGFYLLRPNLLEEAN